MAREQIETGLLALFLLVGVVSAALLLLSGDPVFKRRYFKAYIGLAGALFLIYLAVSGIPPALVAVLAPVVGAIGYINLRTVRFCDACGGTVMSGTYSKPLSCTSCGAAVQ